ncbi:Shedu anti-phage system protein SduA domain-containing protein [Sphaerisporangium dianthi]|uniref:Shedu anti-phage system protein SduA domain-containing protein n=1 Tax=Sphaerisporangium dianthi TaxID=1436120 RepID=A0ABV9CMA6_9ACTN
MTTLHPAEEAIRRSWESRARSNHELHVGRVISGGYPHLVQLVASKLIEAGIDASAIRTNEMLGLPGSYGVDDRWDLVVVADGIPVAAIEIKGMAGKGLGNNYRNRISELLSRGADVDRQYSTGALKMHKPCLGVLFLLEEAEGSTRPISKPATLIQTEDGSSSAASYKDRFGEFFDRLLRDRLYDAVCYLTATPLPDVQVSEPRPDMGFDNFVSVIAERVSHLDSLKNATGLDSVRFGELLALRNDLGSVMSGLTSTPIGLSAAELAVIERRRQIVNELIALSLDPRVNETRMQKAIGNNYWLFGGQYTGIASRRNLMPLDEHDIPLICADGSLEIFELKGPEAKIVKRHRNHLVVSNEVHEAVSQCISYIRTIDETGATLQTVHHNELGLDYDYRRARGVAVIGHPSRVEIDGIDHGKVDQAIRSYNAHLSRVRVVTYADLLESAEGMLSFESEISREV